MGPTLEGYVTFIRTVAGIDAIALPDNSPAIKIKIRTKEN